MGFQNVLKSLATGPLSASSPGNGAGGFDFGDFIKDLGGGLKSSGVGLNDILNVIGRFRKNRQAAPQIGDNPAIAQVLAINARKQQLSKAIADETDPLRKRILENSISELQVQFASQIQSLQRNINRQRASGQPTILAGFDPRRRDEARSSALNFAYGIDIPIAARNQTLQQLQAAAGALGAGPSADTQRNIASVLGDQQEIESARLGFEPQQALLEGLGKIFSGTGAAPVNVGEAQQQSILSGIGLGGNLPTGSTGGAWQNPDLGGSFGIGSRAYVGPLPGGGYST